MSFLSSAVAAWLSAHHGVVTHEELSSLGVTRDERRRLVRCGVLSRVLNGAYRYTGAPDTCLQRCAALCGAHSSCVIALQTAAFIWRMSGFAAEPDCVHALAAHGTRRFAVPWLNLHRVDVLPQEDIVRRPDGIVVTSPPRTIVDLARVLPDDELAVLVEWALSHRLCTIGTLRRVAQRLVSPRRPWVRRLLRLLDDRLPGGPQESSWERRVLAALRKRGVTGLESQVWQTIPGYGAARFDLAIPSLRWVLEVDVHPSHRTTRGESRDNRRDRKARRLGWETERVGAAELKDAFEATMDDLVVSINQRRAEVGTLIASGLWT